MRIGMPRTLWYFSYAPFWRTFLTGLGAAVVPSPPTTRRTLDDGVTACVSEACLPIKLYFGHVMALCGKVDYIFVPRLMSVHPHRVFCPKFLGLPDLIRHSGLSLPPLLEPTVDRRTGRLFLWRACLDLGRRLGASPARSTEAFLEALRVYHTYADGLLAGSTPDGAKPIPPRGRPAGSPSEPSIRMALLGYPYLIFDDYANLGLVERLRAMGIRYRTIETVPESTLRRQNLFFAKRPFWRYSDLVARAGYHFIGPGRNEVDGVIHVTAFACGPDALVDKILELEAERKGFPYLNITLDEQSGEAGYITRLEAFVDLLRRKAVTRSA